MKGLKFIIEITPKTLDTDIKSIKKAARKGIKKELTKRVGKIIENKEIEYKKNRLVMFLNSPYSLHGVTKRSKTTYYRKYINIIGEFNFELFNYRNFLEK